MVHLDEPAASCLELLHQLAHTLFACVGAYSVPIVYAVLAAATIEVALAVRPD